MYYGGKKKERVKNMKKFLALALVFCFVLATPVFPAAVAQSGQLTISAAPLAEPPPPVLPPPTRN